MKREETDLDSMLLTIENPIRRQIIKRLSQEPSYQLQISRELGFSQQLVAKHLDSMEDSGVVSSLMESSPHGPMRKEYLLNKSVSLTIDFAPNLFRAKIMSFAAMPEPIEAPPSYGLTSKVNEAIRQPQENKIGPLGSMIAEIDRKLSDLEDERSVLLYLRHLTMNEVTRVIGGMNLPPEKKKVLYHVIAKQDKDVKAMSRALNLREELIENILKDLDKELVR